MLIWYWAWWASAEEVLLLRVIEATELTTAFAKLRRGERIADNMELRNREAVRSRAFLKASEARQSSWVSCLYMAQRLQVPETSAYFCPSL